MTVPDWSLPITPAQHYAWALGYQVRHSQRLGLDLADGFADCGHTTAHDPYLYGCPGCVKPWQLVELAAAVDSLPADYVERGKAAADMYFRRGHCTGCGRAEGGTV